jgi:hypothetical protein
MLIRVYAAAVNPTDVVMWRTLGGGSVAGKTGFSVELSRVLTDEADGGTVFVALGGGGTGRGIERRSRAVIAGMCLARRRLSNTRGLYP